MWARPFGSAGPALLPLVLTLLFASAPARAAFFVNPDFETGNFSGWTLEYGKHTGLGVASGWTTVLPAGHPAPAIVTGATATFPGQTLAMVPHGTYMARINDNVGGTHATRISQTVVLAPSDLSAGDYLKFGWAAALEDGNHLAGEQPFFLMEVLVSGNVVLSYSPDANTAKSDGSGFVSAGVGGGGGKLWFRQGTLCIPVADKVGLPLTIRVTAADCIFTAHGGFAYIDDVELGPPCCPETPLVHYTFDDPADRGADDTGHGIQGTLDEAIPVPGRCGAALRFRPNNDVPEFHVVDNGGTLNLTGAMTGMAWIRVRGTHSTDFNSGCTEGTLFSKGGSYWFQLERNSDRLVFQNEGSGNEVATANVTIGGDWTCVGFVRGPWTGTGQSIQFYVNGAPVPTVVTDNGSVVPSLQFPGAANNAPFMVGNYGFGNDPGACEFNGDIDDIRIYDRALTIDEMLDAYTSCPCATPDSLCSPGASTLTLDTGWDADMSAAISFGSPDHEWMVTQDPDAENVVPRPAITVADDPDPLSPLWASPLPGSRWVSSHGFMPDFVSHGNHVLEYHFCLADTFDASLDATLREWVEAIAFLNGVRVGPTYFNTGLPGQTPGVLHVAAGFRAGDNVLSFRFDNYNNPVGLDLVGTVQGHIPLSAACCSESTAVLMGRVWKDLDEDGVQDAGEPPLVGWQVQLTGTQSRTMSSDANGVYAFTKLPAGSYGLYQFPPSGWTSTFPPKLPPSASGSYTLLLDAGESWGALDFGRDELVQTGVNDSPRAARRLRIDGIWPNPVAGSMKTRLRVTIPVASEVRVRIVDIAGRVVSEILPGRLEAGSHALEWHPPTAGDEAVRPGVYSVQLLAGSSRASARMVIVR